jgi:hypothetical protein
LHLTHSQNDKINILQYENLIYSPGLQRYAGRGLHEVWSELLSNKENTRFVGTYWDKALAGLDTSDWYSYCEKRYM